MHRSIAYFASLLCVVACSSPKLDEEEACEGKCDGVQDADGWAPVGEWSGRLILPSASERRAGDGVQLEVRNAPRQDLIGQTLWLLWEPSERARVDLVTTDVRFSSDATESIAAGNIHPTRLDGWDAVGPLESLAGAHPVDDILVRLDDARFEDGVLRIRRDPVQVSGDLYALVRFLGPAGDGRWEVQHYDAGTEDFDGPTEVLRAETEAGQGALRTLAGIESSPLNDDGWFVYGVPAEDGMRLRAIEPRALTRVEPDRVLRRASESHTYVRHGAWENMEAAKGSSSSVLMEVEPDEEEDAGLVAERYPVGERLVVLHLFGGIEGEGASIGPLRIVTGHFSFGTAEVKVEPFTGELRFDILYSQIYANNPDGIVAGTIAYHNYMGDLARGWMYTRPVADALLRMPWITQPYDFSPEDLRFDAFEGFRAELEVMAQRYRTGNGTGAAIVTPANSCVQDSSQALFVALMKYEEAYRDSDIIREWVTVEGEDHEQSRRIEQLDRMSDQVLDFLTPLGRSRADWRASADEVGAVEGCPGSTIRQIACGLGSYRTIFPRYAFDRYIERALTDEAGVWMLRTNQVGGRFDGYGPLEPTSPTRM